MTQSAEELVDRFRFLETELPDGNPLYDWIDAETVEPDDAHAARREIVDVLTRDMEKLGCNRDAWAWAARLEETVDDIPDWLLLAFDIVCSSYEELQWAIVKVHRPVLRSMAVSWWPESASDVVIKLIEEALALWKATEPGVIEEEIKAWRADRHRLSSWRIH